MHILLCIHSYLNVKKKFEDSKEAIKSRKWKDIQCKIYEYENTKHFIKESSIIKH